MRLPNTPALSRFAQRCTTARTDTITVNRSDAQQVAREYQDLLEYCVQLQCMFFECPLTLAVCLNLFEKIWS